MDFYLIRRAHALYGETAITEWVLSYANVIKRNSP